MRNKDGVFESIGCLKKYLGFDIDARAAAQYLSGMPTLGSSPKGDEVFSEVQRQINPKGYTGMEYAGYVMYFHKDTRKEGRIQHLRSLSGQDWISAFLQFKVGRRADLAMRVHLQQDEYKRALHAGVLSPVEIIEKRIKVGTAFRLNLLLRNEADFAPEYIEHTFQRYAGAFKAQLCISPELIVVCEHLTRKLKRNGGNNEWTRAAFNTPC